MTDENIQESPQSSDNTEPKDVVDTKKKDAGPDKLGPQSFIMIREKDETGVSGTGAVLEGIVFSNGKCSTCWSTGRPCVTVWDNFEAFKEVHIDPHPENNTDIIWNKWPREDKDKDKDDQT